MAPRLRSLPCPVIGIGEGNPDVGAACDLLVSHEDALASIIANIQAAPIAAMTIVQLLRLSEHLPLEDAFVAESLAYATLQNGPEFRRWHAGRADPPAAAPAKGPDLRIDARDDRLLLTMNRPETHNAIGVGMRDALCQAFDLACADDGFAKVDLRAIGRCFSIGGDLREFGSVSDPATAHSIRSVRLPAQHLLPIRDRLRVRIDGAAIGAGIEIAALAKHVAAGPNAWFQLPELRYGLIPGAGGTVGIPRRIGRQRACLLMLSTQRISARTALSWGLIDELSPPDAAVTGQRAASTWLSSPGARMAPDGVRIG